LTEPKIVNPQSQVAQEKITTETGTAVNTDSDPAPQSLPETTKSPVEQVAVNSEVSPEPPAETNSTSLDHQILYPNDTTMRTNDPSFLSANSSLQDDLDETENVLEIVAGNLSQSAPAANDVTPASIQIPPSAPAAPRKRPASSSFDVQPSALPKRNRFEPTRLNIGSNHGQKY
jgi:hypothetical protein